MLPNSNKNGVKQAIRVLIVDDSTTLRQQVKALLATEPNIEVIGEVMDGTEVIAKARALKPNLVLLDLRLPGQNGVETTHEIKAEFPEVSVIILTMYDMQIYRDAAIANGANDYVIKRSMSKQLLPTIRRVMQIDNLDTDNRQNPSNRE